MSTSHSYSAAICEPPVISVLTGETSVPPDDGGASFLLLPTVALVGRAKDITDQRFGRLIALRPVSINAHYRWLCRCDCGRYFVTRCNNLTSGNTKSCGCLRPQRIETRLLRERFHQLTVVAYAGKDRQGNTLWHCICDCGKKKIIRANPLTKGLTKSCGCLRSTQLRRLHASGRTSGKNNSNWNPNLSAAEHENQRGSQMESIRNHVFKRDNYTCLCCGERGKRLNAHHMIPWSKSRELRFDPDNLVTLCTTCHRTYHIEHNYRCANAQNFIIWFKNHHFTAQREKG